MSSIHLLIFCLCLFVGYVSGQFKGGKCTLKKTGEKGKCIEIDACSYARKLIQSREKPQNCGFTGFTPIVCCPLSDRDSTNLNVQGVRKSILQCDSYYPKPKEGETHILVFGGEQASAKEFPHMAILGYTNGNSQDVEWLCGGSLISNQFVLTAAHCLESPEFGSVKRVRLGDLDIKNTTDDAFPQDFTVKQFYAHPDYKSNSHYHDIALIRLNKKAVFNSYVKPACLYPNTTIPQRLIATGWGRTDFLGETSNILMKVNLNYIDHKQCAQHYKNQRKLTNGIVDKLQMCAGDRDGKDTCPGDSGGPLQFKVLEAPARFYILGVTSFGKACGLANSVGVYTRVATYLEWIGNIVWP